MAGLSVVIDIDKTAAALPRRIHERAGDHVDSTPDQIALIEDCVTWTYRDLHGRVAEIVTVLSSLGVRAGDRMMIVSENCIALAGLSLAASLLDAWAVVANPRLPGRELDQICVKPTDLTDVIKPGLASYMRPPKIVVVDVLPGSSTGKMREHELANCLHADRAAARQAVKFQQRTHLT